MFVNSVLMKSEYHEIDKVVVPFFKSGRNRQEKTKATTSRSFFVKIRKGKVLQGT